MCIYINTRASKFHWTSSPVITDGNESSSPCFLQLNTLTNFEQSPVRGDTRGRALSSFTHYHSSSDFPHGHWLDDGIILFENSHRSWPPYDARRNPTICGSLQPSNLRIDTRTHLEESLVARERTSFPPLRSIISFSKKRKNQIKDNHRLGGEKYYVYQTQVTRPIFLSPLFDSSARPPRCLHSLECCPNTLWTRLHF